MRGPESMISTLINLAVIFFIFKVVVKAAKKHKQNQPGKQEGETVFPKTVPQAPRQIRQNRTIEPRKVRFETKPRMDDNLQLKRCPHCGGEIPVMMMTCEICGHRQAGFSAALWIIIATAAGIIVALIAGSDNNWAEIFRQIEQWLGQK